MVLQRKQTRHQLKKLKELKNTEKTITGGINKMHKKMDDFEKYLEEQLKDPEFKKYWGEETERLFVHSLIEARNNSNLTQAQLSKLTGIDQSNLSKIETGNGNPSLKTLKKIAKALNTTLEIQFKPIEKQM